MQGVRAVSIFFHPYISLGMSLHRFLDFESEKATINSCSSYYTQGFMIDDGSNVGKKNDETFQNPGDIGSFSTVKRIIFLQYVSKNRPLKLSLNSLYHYELLYLVIAVVVEFSTVLSSFSMCGLLVRSDVS